MALDDGPRFQHTSMEIWTDIDPAFPRTHLFIGHSANGDYYILDLADPAASSDAPVLYLDHETGTFTRRWEGVADFLETVVFGT